MVGVHLTAESIRRLCSLDLLPFKTTAEINPFSEIIGQERAKEAIGLALSLPHKSYNIFALGVNGIGKKTLVISQLLEHAKNCPAGRDYCYLFNVDIPYQPLVLDLAAGEGSTLKKALGDLRSTLKTLMTALFRDMTFRSKIRALESDFEQREGKLFKAIALEAKKSHLKLMKTDDGIAIVPCKDDDTPITPPEFDALPDDKQKFFEAAIADIQKKLESILLDIAPMHQEKQDAVDALTTKTLNDTIQPVFTALHAQWQHAPAVLDYFSNMQTFFVKNYTLFLPTDEAKGMDPFDHVALFEVNLFLDRTQLTHYSFAQVHHTSHSAPVISVEHPTYNTLFGRIEYMAKEGGITTDFTLIRPGALHLANGGYLLLDARKILEEPWVWDRLKYTLKTGRLQIENRANVGTLGQNIITIDPAAIDLNLKVILLGDASVYMALVENDPEFESLFSMTADFATTIPNTPDAVMMYARILASVCRDENLLHLEAQAVAYLIEEATAMADDQQKLTTHIGSLIALLRESHVFAVRAHRTTIVPDDVAQAIHFQRRRYNRLYMSLQEQISDNTFLIETEGLQVGQINALAVISIFDREFGTPHRISCSVYKGKQDVIDIERASQLSGSFHAKGVLILSAFLHQRFSQEEPLTFSAMLTFEQSYSKIDGDSASSTELYALLSALADVPIKQCFAVTGSVDQKGRVQAIGGVNEKIQGFFDICKERGLNGTHGVIIPKSNVKNLQLDLEIVDAVRAGQFHIHAIGHVDEGIELLTGVSADDINAKIRKRFFTKKSKKEAHDKS